MIRSMVRTKRRRLLFGSAMLCVIAALISLFLFSRSSERQETISRKDAGRKLALAVADQETIDIYTEEHGNIFPDAEKNTEWYDNYLTYLVGCGYLKKEAADRRWANDEFTMGDAMTAAEKVSAGLAEDYHAFGNRAESAFSRSEWDQYYTRFLTAADPERHVVKKTFTVYGTAKDAEKLKQWEAVTSIGTVRYEGGMLDGWTDRDVTALMRGNSVIGYAEVSSEHVLYPNAWVSREDGMWNVYIGGIVRKFRKIPGIDEKAVEGAKGVIADVSVKEGKPSDAVIKKETVEGKILSVGDGEIEIEDVGTLPMAEDFHVFKVYGETREVQTDDLLVGYDLGQIVVENGKACAALLVRDLLGDNIRVLIMTDDFSTIFHDMAVLKSEGGLIVTGEGETRKIPANERFTIRMSDAMLKRGRVTVRPADESKEIELTSIRRLTGRPTCQGTIELRNTKSGMLIINELKMEDYLKRVVPSEMPDSFPIEALKAQAIIARTFAYRQIRNNSYSRYGAHVDDSTNCQVYNNISETEKTNEAVKATEGIMMFAGDEPANVNYFSTSCGYTTDPTAWGSDDEKADYITSRYVGADDPGADMSKDENFTTYIMKKDGKSYDSSYPMYRWTAEFTGKWAKDRIAGIGTIYGFFVEKRAPGGSALRIRVVGSKGEKVLRGMMSIRRILGSPYRTYHQNGGGKISGIDLLPSAFIHIDETGRTESGDRIFTVWGGGMGHGIGLSQNAAGKMAAEGMDCEQILRFFYPQVDVQKR